MADPRNSSLRRLGSGLGEERPSTGPRPDEDEDNRRNRQAVVDYFLLLQEWSMKPQPDDLVGGPNGTRGAASRARKRR